MGFFGKIFEKKECSVCGGEIGLLGNRKLEDGNLCKECAKKLSPWFDDRRHSTVEQIEKQLNKKLDVIKVKTFKEEDSISRELMLIKIKYNKGNRRDVMDICTLMDAKIVDMSKTHMIIQVCDLPERTAAFIKMLQGISVVEVARTGTLALQKCSESDV